MKVLTQDQILANIKNRNSKIEPNRIAMYSSWHGGIITDPSLMFVPIDDHIVHRGDGVFEAFRISAGAVYDMDSHLSRLERSAESIGIQLPEDTERLRAIILETVKVSAQKEGVVRLYVSRGPGGFTANPFESIGSQLYIVITPFKTLDDSIYKHGGTVGVSSVPPKGEPWSQVKSCNYLQNVMMKKETVEKGWSFSFSVRADGFICEGATENLVIVSDGVLIVPRYDYTLKGTTLERVLALAKLELGNLPLKAINQRDVHLDEVFKADEVFFIGTTIEVAPMTRIESRAGDKSEVGTGVVGPLAKRLRELLRRDIESAGKET